MAELTTTVVVFGASGDLAKKKVYPSLFALHRQGFLPRETLIMGYARSNKTNSEFKEGIQPYLKGDKSEIKAFLDICYYCVGKYHVARYLKAAFDTILAIRKALSREIKKKYIRKCENRIFYMAIPPSRFSSVAAIIKEAGMSSTGWNRIVVEKPFGRDTESSKVLSEGLKALFREDQVYRIDHYLGKPGVRAIPKLLAKLDMGPLSRSNVSSILINWEENFGTQGRGGYFDPFGIIRDIAQNHLTQILALIAMNSPGDKSTSQDSTRAAKAAVLSKISPVGVAEAIIGQYRGYREEKGIPGDSITPTFALMRVNIRNSRWRDIPFYIRCGKCLKSKICEVVINLRPQGKKNVEKLRIRIQPKPALELEMVGGDRKELHLIPSGDIDGGAYAVLLHDVLKGVQKSFVRFDELQLAWKIFTPLLHALERERISPYQYEPNSNGPPASLRVLREFENIDVSNTGKAKPPRSKL